MSTSTKTLVIKTYEDTEKKFKRYVDMGYSNRQILINLTKDELRNKSDQAIEFFKNSSKDDQKKSIHLSLDLEVQYLSKMCTQSRKGDGFTSCIWWDYECPLYHIGYLKPTKYTNRLNKLLVYYATMSDRSYDSIINSVLKVMID